MTHWNSWGTHKISFDVKITFYLINLMLSLTMYELYTHAIQSQSQSHATVRDLVKCILCSRIVMCCS